VRLVSSNETVTDGKCIDCGLDILPMCAFAHLGRCGKCAFKARCTLFCCIHDAVTYESEHPKHNAELKSLLGKTGFVLGIEQPHWGTRYLVEFSDVGKKFWISEKYLRRVPH